MTVCRRVGRVLSLTLCAVCQRFKNLPDSGCRWKLMRWCEKHDVDYVFGIGRNKVLER